MTADLPDVLATIDGALADYSMSADAMRWTVDPAVQLAAQVCRTIGHPPCQAHLAAARTVLNVYADPIRQQPARHPTDHPWNAPGDGRTECDTCGKWVWPITHSCKGHPVTEAAQRRAAERRQP